MPSLASATSGRGGVAFMLGLPAKRSRQDNSMWGRLASVESLLSSPATAALPHSSRRDQCMPTCSSFGHGRDFRAGSVARVSTTRGCTKLAHRRQVVGFRRAVPDDVVVEWRTG